MAIDLTSFRESELERSHSEFQPDLRVIRLSHRGKRRSILAYRGDESTPPVQCPVRFFGREGHVVISVGAMQPHQTHRPSAEMGSPSQNMLQRALDALLRQLVPVVEELGTMFRPQSIALHLPGGGPLHLPQWFEDAIASLGASVHVYEPQRD